MLYAIQAATGIMLGCMFWLAFYRLRADRVATQRYRTRGKHAFRPRERLRFLLKRSFPMPDEQPEWEQPIVSRLTQVPVPGRTLPADAPPRAGVKEEP